MELGTHSVSFSIMSTNRKRSLSQTEWDAYWDYQLSLRVANEVGTSCRSCLPQYPPITTYVGDKNWSYWQNSVFRNGRYRWSITFIEKLRSIISKVWLAVEFWTHPVSFSIVSRNRKKSLSQTEWDTYWDYQLSLKAANEVGTSSRSCLRQYLPTTLRRRWKLIIFVEKVDIDNLLPSYKSWSQ